MEVLLTEDLSAEEGPGTWTGHAAHQDPDADGTTLVTGVPASAVPGDLLLATVSSGIDDCHVGQVDSTYAALPNQPAPVTVPTSPAGSPSGSGA